MTGQRQTPGTPHTAMGKAAGGQGGREDVGMISLCPGQKVRAARHPWGQTPRHTHSLSPAPRTHRITITNFCLGKHLVSEGDLLKDQRGSPAYISPDVLSGACTVPGSGPPARTQPGTTAACSCSKPCLFSYSLGLALGRKDFWECEHGELEGLPTEVASELGW